jgi:hypothetical protein
MRKKMAKKNIEETQGAEETGETATQEVPAGATRARKLSKSIEGTVIKIEVIGQETAVYDFSELPADIQAKLGPFGLASKLGDAAAGRDGADAVESIKKVWEGLTKGDWTSRAPAAPKVTISTIKENLAKLSDSERAAAETLLAGLGVKL